MTDHLAGTIITYEYIDLPYGYFYLSYILVMMIPSLAIPVRRLHDVGKSGWMMLIMLIPIIGAIWLLILLCQDGNPESNQYGINPKSADVLDNTTTTATVIAPDQPKETQDSYAKKIKALKELKELLDAGILTQEEFDQQKNRTLNQL